MWINLNLYFFLILYIFNFIFLNKNELDRGKDWEEWKVKQKLGIV